MRSSARTDRRTSTIGRLLLLAGIAFVMSACGSSAARPAQGAAAAAPAGGPVLGAASGAPGAGSENGSQNAANGEPAALVDDTKIVRTGSLEVTVADTDKAVLAARDAIRGLGGYIGASQQQRTDDKVVAMVTYRIPVARWEDALTAIRGLGTEVNEQTQAVEVTGQLVDLDARIRNLKASESGSPPRPRRPRTCSRSRLA